MDGVMDEIDLLREMRAEMKRAGGLRAFAEANGISASYLSEETRGDKVPSDRILRAFGYRKIVRFAKIRTKEPAGA